MSGRTPSILIAAVSIGVALFLAWRVGLWLEPEPDGVPDVPIQAPTSPPYAKGQVSPELHFELRDVRLSEEGKRAEGFGIVRYSVKREEVRPVAEAMLRTLKAKAPVAEIVFLTLRPAVDCPACDIAEVSWKKGVAEIRFGIPSMAQIEEWNLGVGKIDGRVPLHLPDRETFSAGIAVIMAMDALKKQKPETGEESLLEQAAQQAGVPYATAKRSREFIRAYYTGNRYGSEKFDLKLQ